MSSTGPNNNAINELQEFAQKNKLEMPSYNITTHSPESHTATVQFLGMNMSAISQTKKEAKRQAAQKLLIQLHQNEGNTKMIQEVIQDFISKATLKESTAHDKETLSTNNENNTDKSASSKSNPICKLQEYAQKNDLPLPIYDYKYDGSKSFTAEVKFLEFQVEAKALTKKQAKYDAAEKMLAQLDPIIDKPKKSQNGDATSDTEIDTVGLLESFCRTNNKPLPLFNVQIVMKECNGGLKEMFEATCNVDGFKYSNYAPDREEAVEMVAKQAFHMTYMNNTGPVSTKSTTPSKKINYAKIEKFEDIQERHNFFRNYPAHMKEKAFAVIYTQYDSNKEKAEDILRALDLTYTLKKEFNSVLNEDYYYMELICEYNPLFCGTYQEIYDDLIMYFNTMLR